MVALRYEQVSGITILEHFYWFQSYYLGVALLACYILRTRVTFALVFGLQSTRRKGPELETPSPGPRVPDNVRERSFHTVNPTMGWKEVKKNELSQHSAISSYCGRQHHHSPRCTLEKRVRRNTAAWGKVERSNRLPS
jgi:hypothetical protein